MDTPDISIFAGMGIVLFGLCIVQTRAFVRIPTDSNIIQRTSSAEKYANVHTTNMQSPIFRRRRAADEFPDEIDVDLSTEGLQTRFTLHRNHDVTDDVVVLLTRDGQTHKHRVVSREPVAYYTNSDIGASFMVSESSGDSATNKFKLFGMFIDLTDSVEYLVQPPDSTHHKHTISRIIEKESIGADYLSIPDVELPNVAHVQHKQKNIPPRREKREAINYEVEILFVIDSVIYKYWYDLTEGEADQHLATVEYIKEFFAFILSSMNLRLESASGSDYTISCLFAGIKIFADEDPSFVTDNLIKIPEVRAYMDFVGNDVLTDFQAWAQANLNTTYRYDHAMYFTGYDIGTNASGTLDNLREGMAFTPTYDANNRLVQAGVCGDYKYSVVEGVGFSATTVSLCAHELGHSIGAKHDAILVNGCREDDGYIMSGSYSVTHNSTKNLRFWIYSTCSRDYFTTYFNALPAYLNERSLGNCLTSRDSLDPSGLDPYLGQFGGQVNDPDAQCETDIGSGSYMHRGFFVNDYSSFCSIMPCTIDSYGTHYSLTIPWDGTTCGNGKMCMNGYCVTSTSAPAVNNETCLFGDVPQDVPNKNLTCKEYLGTDPTSYHCYNPYDRGSCCNTCEQIRLTNLPLNLTDCPYGDKGGDSCDANNCDTYSTETRQEWCCLTCPAPTTHSTTMTTTTTATSSKPTNSTTHTTTPTSSTPANSTTHTITTATSSKPTNSTTHTITTATSSKPTNSTTHTITTATSSKPTNSTTHTTTPTSSTPANSTTHTTTTATSSPTASTTSTTGSIRTVAATVVFPFSTQNVDLTGYAMQQKLVTVLRYYFDKSMEGGLEGLIIQHVLVRGGRLTISYELEYDGSSEAASEFTKANIDLVVGQETVTILNETVSATSIQINTVNVTNEAVFNSAKVCEVFLAVTGPCHEKYYCRVAEDLPMCFLHRTQSEMFRLFLVIGIIALVFVCIVLACFKIRAYRLRNSVSPEERQDSLLASSTEMDDRHAGNKLYNMFGIPQNSQVNANLNRASLTIDSADRY